MEGASSRYRVYQYIPFLESLGVTCVTQSFMNAKMYKTYFSRGKTVQKFWLMLKAVFARMVALRQYPDFDIIYMQRELLPLAPPLFERFMKRRGAILIFDYDDALFIRKPSRYNPIAAYLRSPDKTLQLFTIVDCVVAGNNWLRDRARMSGAQAITIEVAEDTTRIPMHAPHSNNGPVTIGWLGSTSTVKYLHLITPALQKIAREYAGAVRFEVMGGGDFTMEGVPWNRSDWSLEEELNALARFDIGLMPLPVEDWAKGKSGGKARTYMAAGVVPVCTAIGYNLSLIDHQKSGCLCNTENEWYLSLKYLIDNPAQRQRLALNAREHVVKNFSGLEQAQKIRQLFDDVVASSTSTASRQSD